MNICYLLGNGFDLSLLMKTSYKNFLDDYLSINNENKEIVNDIQKLKTYIIDKGYDENSLWSDCELGFAEFTGEFSDSVEDKQSFLNAYFDFLSNLANYLRQEQSKLNSYNMDIIVDEFISTIINFDKKLLPDDSQIYANVLSVNEDINVNIINFNYTESVDAIAFDYVNKKKKLGKHRAFDIQLNEIVHIHGMNDEGMILGVNDHLQLKNPSFADILVKHKINEYKKLGIPKHVEEILQASKVYVIFGMSIGATDKYWFEYIANKVLNDMNRLIVIIGYYDKHSFKYPQQIHFKDEEYVNKFLSMTSLDEKQKNNVRKRIIVESNTQVFGFKIELKKN